MKTSFFAYPTHPDEIARTLRSAITKHNALNNTISLEPWEINDISGPSDY